MCLKNKQDADVAKGYQCGRWQNQRLVPETRVSICFKENGRDILQSEGENVIYFAVSKTHADYLDEENLEWDLWRIWYIAITEARDDSSLGCVVMEMDYRHIWETGLTGLWGR